jgi:DNA-binding GntR family transcriptional regulator
VRRDSEDRRAAATLTDRIPVRCCRNWCGDLSKQVQKAKQNSIERPKHLSLVDIAYQALVEAIVNQVFEPGTQINIDMLARDLNMSNTPVREALMRVMGERFVEQKTNKGFIVTNFLNQVEIQNMFTVRQLLETHALLSGTVTESKISLLDKLTQEMETTDDGLLYQEFKDFLHKDHLFHHTIASLSENDFLIQSWENLNVHLHLSRLYTGGGLFDRDKSSSEHIGIVQALKNNNHDLAVELLNKHIKDVENRLVTFLNNLESAKE